VFVVAVMQHEGRTTVQSVSQLNTMCSRKPTGKWSCRDYRNPPGCHSLVSYQHTNLHCH